jgi:hypothetical protein
MPIVVASGASTVIAQSIIDNAYTLLGYKSPSDTLSGQDSTYALSRLNDLIDSWNTQTLFIYTTTEVVATASGKPITIGPGQTVNTARPVRLPEGSYARISGLDYPITWIDTQQYQSIVLKSTASTIPIYGFYDGGAPTGNLYFWPYQTTATEYHILVETQLTEWPTPTTPVTLTQGYRRALTYSLAEELAPGYCEVPAIVARNAMNARRAIRQANAVVPVLKFADNGTSPIARFIAGV